MQSPRKRPTEAKCSFNRLPLESVSLKFGALSSSCPVRGRSSPVGPGSLSDSANTPAQSFSPTYMFPGTDQYSQCYPSQINTEMTKPQPILLKNPTTCFSFKETLVWFSPDCGGRFGYKQIATLSAAANLEPCTFPQRITNPAFYDQVSCPALQLKLCGVRGSGRILQPHFPL